MFGMFTRRSEDEQKRKREAEDRARRARFESESAAIGGSYEHPWPLGVSGAGGYSPHAADTSPCSTDSGSSSSSDGGSCGGGGD